MGCEIWDWHDIAACGLLLFALAIIVIDSLFFTTDD